MNNSHLQRLFTPDVPSQRISIAFQFRTIHFLQRHGQVGFLIISLGWVSSWMLLGSIATLYLIESQ